MRPEPEPGFYETKHMIAITESLRREVEDLKAQNAILRNLVRSMLETPGTGEIPGATHNQL